MKAIERFERYIRNRHNLTLDDVVIANVPGFWDVKEPCPGGENCRHAYRGYIGSCDGGGLTIYFVEHGRDERGRFLSPTRAWKEIKEATDES